MQKFNGPSLDKVREETLRREIARTRQLKKILVDRQLQNAKDIEAMEKFRLQFYVKNTHQQLQQLPPIGTGEKIVKAKTRSAFVCLQYCLYSETNIIY
jgi:hypothetical protein